MRLERTLNFKQHLEEIAGNGTPRVSPIGRLADRTWGASAKTLRILTQAQVFSVAENYTLVWSRIPHVKKVDVAINNPLGTISGRLKPTPVFPEAVKQPPSPWQGKQGNMTGTSCITPRRTRCLCAYSSHINPTLEMLRICYAYKCYPRGPVFLTLSYRNFNWCRMQPRD